jgi:hypothetical protein
MMAVREQAVDAMHLLGQAGEFGGKRGGGGHARSLPRKRKGLLNARL